MVQQDPIDKKLQRLVVLHPILEPLPVVLSSPLHQGHLEWPGYMVHNTLEIPIVLLGINSTIVRKVRYVQILTCVRARPRSSGMNAVHERAWADIPTAWYAFTNSSISSSLTNGHL